MSDVVRMSDCEYVEMKMSNELLNEVVSRIKFQPQATSLFISLHFLAPENYGVTTPPRS